MLNVRGVRVDCGAAIVGLLVGDDTAVGLLIGCGAIVGLLVGSAARAGLLVGPAARVGLLVGRAVAVGAATVRLAATTSVLLGAALAVARGVRVGGTVEVTAISVAGEAAAAG